MAAAAPIPVRLLLAIADNDPQEVATIDLPVAIVSSTPTVAGDLAGAALTLDTKRIRRDFRRGLRKLARQI